MVLPPETTTRTAHFGIASNLARHLGKTIGKSWQDSEWKQVRDAFQDGLEESEINARARNAKNMESPPLDSGDTPLLVKQQRQKVVDAEIVDDNKSD